MKVFYDLKMPVELKEIKEILKPYGGRCAKINDGKLEYQIKEEKEQEALQALKEKGLVD
ncbi:hypothetical protein [Tepidibacillus fermentans]|uniref:Uncharacterized protein n=1 Tax=Tepidibacillus fermentans TaxID=1281767 RepID=A0A4R3KLU8_9BACI|nr:hypothetical protein [Tepidibacillus fermentans]TCS84570.1 hypothetical protein EDD72_101239 [Tepidibacillus fermentans]